jgi:hypothetical protein
MTKTCNPRGLQNKRKPALDLSYTCGCQRSTDGIFIPYQNLRKVFIYFALMGRVKIYGPPGIHLKNKNIFATMISLMNKGINIPHLSPIAIT